MVYGRPRRCRDVVICAASISRHCNVVKGEVDGMIPYLF